jgi:hypothetical protein
MKTTRRCGQRATRIVHTFVQSTQESGMDETIQVYKGGLMVSPDIIATDRNDGTPPVCSSIMMDHTRLSMKTQGTSFLEMELLGLHLGIYSCRVSLCIYPRPSCEVTKAEGNSLDHNAGYNMSY